MIVDINSTTNKYGIIYTDPPWQQNRGGERPFDLIHLVKIWITPP